MVTAKGVLDRLKERGEEVLAQVSGELMSNPRFLKAVETAYKGKETVDRAVGQALKSMNLPTRTEFKKAVTRVDALEKQIQELKDALAKAKAGPKARPRARKPKAPSAPPAASA